MTETANRLEELIRKGTIQLTEIPGSVFDRKVLPGKWSKKEMLGHLIDSAINNLQRFTEIQFEPKPYVVRKYKQDELVGANAYQEAESGELLNLWGSLNGRIIRIMQNQTETTLSYPVQLPNGQLSDLHFLMTDYVDHLEYHLKQMMRTDD